MTWTLSLSWILPYEATRYLVEHGADVLALNDEQEMPWEVSDNETVKKYLSDLMEARGIDTEKIDQVKNKENRELERDIRKWLDEGWASVLFNERKDLEGSSFSFFLFFLFFRKQYRGFPDS